MLVFNRDKAELEAEFRNPGIPETGLSVEELKAGLLRLAGRKKDGSRAVVKAEAFSYLLDNMRIGVSARDLFVTLGVWGRKPFDDAILPGWKQELFDGALREAAARAGPFRTTGPSHSISISGTAFRTGTRSSLSASPVFCRGRRPRKSASWNAPEIR